MIAQDAKPPEEASILGRRFRLIEMCEDNTFILWDMGDILMPKAAPEVWLAHTYWDQESRDKASIRLRFIAGVLNNIRQPSEVLEIA